MLVKFEQNHMVQTTQNFELFEKKNGVFMTIFDKKHNILYGSGHTILFKFHQHVVQILIK